ncbi:MAG: TonB family protein [Candidatus Omnitrophota bacterium]
MKDFRLLQGAVLLSLSAHALAIFGGNLLPCFKVLNEDKQIKVTYIKIEHKPKELPNPLREKMPKGSPPPFIEPKDIRKDNNIQKPKELKFDKPELMEPEVVALKKIIKMPAIEPAKIDNPSYISYYQTVREKIRRSAYRNYAKNETGEVYLVFIISNDGVLKQARLVEEKSSKSLYLKNVALSSIKDASPFPNFPKELDYEELSFNVAISFELE